MDLNDLEWKDEYEQFSVWQAITICHEPKLIIWRRTKEKDSLVFQDFTEVEPKLLEVKNRLAAQVYLTDWLEKHGPR